MLELSFDDRWRIYETLVYMAWGDERLAPSEVTAARVVAEELDLDADELAPGSRLQAGPPLLGDVGLDHLPPYARHVAYATAAWMAFADGYEHPAERAVLTTLRHRMGLDEETAFVLESSALLVSAQGRHTPPRAQYRALLHAIEDVLGAELWGARIPSRDPEDGGADRLSS